MNGSETHPARSPEFLSRLHDGELDAAERARFEAHRAHCAECREAAAQLEEALAFFRSARPRPAAPDLSARILRKLRAASPRRRAFGQVFGIDLRWAGAFAAALLAVIVGSSIVAEREGRGRRAIRDSAVPVILRQRATTAPPPAPKPAPASGSEAAARTKVVAPPRRERPPVVSELSRSNGEPQGRAQAPEPAKPAAPGPAAAGPQAPAAPPQRVDEAVRDKMLAKSRDSEERETSAGGEARRDSTVVQRARAAAAAAPAAPEPGRQAVRVRVIATDGKDVVPEISNLAELSFFPADRGEYAVHVRADGSVSSVRPIESKQRSEKVEGAERHAIEELGKLRFATADLARELILRVE